MAPSAAHSTASAQSVSAILPKLNDQDPDLRYMGLNDLAQLLSDSPQHLLSAQSDFSVAAKTADALVECLQDNNGEVQNMAVKCVGPYVNRAPEVAICSLIEKISMLPSDSVVDTSIPALALRQIVISLPRPVPGVPRSKQVLEAYSAISRSMIPRLTGYVVVPSHAQNRLPKPPPSMLAMDMEQGTDSSAMDVLIEVANCFGSMLRDPEITALGKISLQVIQSPKTGQILKKKAVTALSHFSRYFNNNLLNHFMQELLRDMSTPSLTKAHKKLYFSLLAGVARAIPDQFSPYILQVAASVTMALSQQEIERDIALMEETEERDLEADEIREFALLALESWIEFCPEAMKPLTSDCLSIILRFLKYDPNVADEDMDDVDDFDDDALEGDDFEEDVGADDEDDTSWKVRRCAAKVAHVLITTRSNGDLLEDGTLYSTVAPALVARFKEREETVRIEVLNALSTLIRITGGESHVQDIVVAAAQGTMPPPPSRKRRRVGSDASMIDSQPDTSLHSGHTNGQIPPSSRALQSLEALSGQIVQGLSTLTQSGQLATKQASVVVLKDLVLALHGKLSDYLDSTIPTALAAVTHTTGLGTTSMAANNAYRIDALGFLGAAAEIESVDTLQPHLAKTIPVVIGALKDRYAKVSMAALACVEHFVDACTPPRASGNAGNETLTQLLDALSGLASANDADLEVRRMAIHSIGMLLGQSSSNPALLSIDNRHKGMNLLLNRLLNETTRLSSVRAIDSVATLAQSATDYPSGWATAVGDTLVQQFRKSSRALRGASVSALRVLAANPGCREQITPQAVSKYLPDLQPLIEAADFHLLGPVLQILRSFMDICPQNEGFQSVVQPVSALFKASLPATTMKSLISVVRSYGSHGIGQNLMTALLQDVSLDATPDLVGKAVGNLLVTGRSTLGISIDNFIEETRTAQDNHRKSLALAVLGETACLEGPSCKLTPDFFIAEIAVASEAKATTVAQAAATALGRAGAGNAKDYVPVILSTISRAPTPKAKALVLLSIRELVNSDHHSEIEPYAQQLWNEVMEASQSDEGKAVGSESIGLLVLFEPTQFFPKLQELLISHTSSASLRNLVLSALRVTVSTDSPAAHTKTVTDSLLPLVRSVLDVIPRESDLENRRVALTIINAAAHSRLSEVLVPMLMDIIPVVLQESQVRTELIREVTMGPFKHKVDDGLEIRKAAYECLYTLFSHPILPASSLPSLIAPLVAGISDDAEIRLLSLLSLSKAMENFPGATQPLIGQFIEPFRSFVKTKPKESAVKQEIERLEEGQKAVVKVGVEIQKRYPEGLGPEWAAFWTSLQNEHGAMMKAVAAEDER